MDKLYYFNIYIDWFINQKTHVADFFYKISPITTLNFPPRGWVITKKITFFQNFEMMFFWSIFVSWFRISKKCIEKVKIRPLPNFEFFSNKSIILHIFAVFCKKYYLLRKIIMASFLGYFLLFNFEYRRILIINKSKKLNR